MKPTLPVQLNFMQKAKKGFEIQGKWPINRLSRLSESLVSADGELGAELKFDKMGPVPFIVGHIDAELTLTCQRCMKPMQHRVDLDFKLGLVLNESQMERLPEGLEPYLVEEENNHLPDMLEDEMLLAMPLVAMHEHDCSDYQTDNSQGGNTSEPLDGQQKHRVDADDVKENPFAALKDLLK